MSSPSRKKAIAERSSELATWLDDQRRRPERLDDRQAEALRRFLIEHSSRREKQWQSLYAVLKKHVETKGEMPGTTYVTPEGVQLGAWVRDQVRAFGRGALVPARLGKLEAVEGWTWSATAGDFERGLEHLRFYAATQAPGFPRKMVPPTEVATGVISVDGFPLGRWCRDIVRRWEDLAPEARELLTEE